MSGYNGFSKSNNAVAAERDGRYTLTRAAKLAGVPAELVERYVRSVEWHHVSGWYNRVNYYDVAEISAVFGLAESEDHDVDPEAAAALAAWAPLKAEATRYEGCTAEWIEWSGTRNHPRAVERSAHDIAITIKGAYATLHLPAGDLKKKLGARGFCARTSAGKPLAPS